MYIRADQFACLLTKKITRSFPKKIFTNEFRIYTEKLFYERGTLGYFEIKKDTIHHCFTRRNFFYS